MANSREAQLKWGITKDMTARGWEYVSWLELPHYRLIKREEERLLLEETEEGHGLTSVNDVRSGKPHDAEKQRLAEVIDRINDLYCAKVSGDDKLHFAHEIADRIERNEAVMAQARSYIEGLMLHGLLPNKVTDVVLDALSDHEKQSMPQLGHVNKQAYSLITVIHLH
ncbi:type I restriction enzyme, R subunit [Onishia taeanensis]|uniref:Type I restriction enzyme, R subunit n=1 Tax=Onishia taeanensis TaxID=284577 RepID=A0A1G7PNT0_9GAMM|nr:hypothetical protein [Halomonas taeanensis]SDF87907.1 type I restriction enzyme, R subunit [Halomonas taeanensis]